MEIEYRSTAVHLATITIKGTVRLGLNVDSIFIDSGKRKAVTYAYRIFTDNTIRRGHKYYRLKVDTYPDTLEGIAALFAENSHLELFDKTWKLSRRALAKMIK